MVKTDSDAVSAPTRIAASSSDLPVGQGWMLACSELPTGVALKLQHPEHEPFLLEIALTPAGPVIRTQATALELAASGPIVANCETFSLNARKSVTIGAPMVHIEASSALHAEAPYVEVVATRGDLSLRANDDVKVLGEKILLNCERDPPVPEWIATEATEREETLLPRADCIGDRALLNAATSEE